MRFCQISKKNRNWKKFVIASLVLLFALLFLESILSKVLKQRNFIRREAFVPTNLTHRDRLAQSARIKANCLVPSEGGYVICERLPFTEIECGANSARGSSYKIPNVVHFVWLGSKYNMDFFHEYLALRSVASIQRPVVIYFHQSHATENIVQTELWKRVQREIPCLKILQVSAPSNAFGHQFTKEISRSDFYRLLMLQNMGGIYLDLDVITLRTFNQLRVYEAAMGTSVKDSLSNGIIMTMAKSNFIMKWVQAYRKLNTNNFLTWGIKVPYELYKADGGVNVHVEQYTINRPNPYIDSKFSTTSDNYDLSENFFLHIHPYYHKHLLAEQVLNAREDQLRTMDNTYGAAARVALFGSEDLVFLTDEVPFKRKRPKFVT